MVLNGATDREMRCWPYWSGPVRMKSMSSDEPAVIALAGRGCMLCFGCSVIGGTGGTSGAPSLRVLLRDRSPVGDDERDAEAP